MSTASLSVGIIVLSLISLSTSKCQGECGGGVNVNFNIDNGCDGNCYPVDECRNHCTRKGNVTVYSAAPGQGMSQSITATCKCSNVDEQFTKGNFDGISQIRTDVCIKVYTEFNCAGSSAYYTPTMLGVCDPTPGTCPMQDKIKSLILC